MRKTVAPGVGALAVATSVLAAPTPAFTEERVCRGSIGAVTVDNLCVPQDATCTQTGTTVKGTLTVENGATLTARTIDVAGNVQAEGHARVVVRRSAVDGSIQLVQGRAAVLAGDRGGSDVQSFSNRRAQAFTTTASTATCSASRTTRHPPVAATSCRATGRTSAPRSELTGARPGSGTQCPERCSGGPPGTTVGCCPGSHPVAPDPSRDGIHTSEVPSMPVTLAVADDYPLVVAGLRSVLQPFALRIRVVEGDPTYAGVDVLLHDPFSGPSTAVPHPRRGLGQARTKLLVFSWRTDSHLVASALTRGADGYVAKSASAEELVDAVERVHAGELVVPATQADADDGHLWRGAEHGLSSRESQVLAQVCLGKGNHEIAAGTHLSINTVKTYIRSAYRKIGVTTRPQAVIWALEHGFDSSTSQWGCVLDARPAAVSGLV